MKRRLLVSLAAIMTISALTACGSSNQNTLNIAKEEYLEFELPQAG